MIEPGKRAAPREITVPFERAAHEEISGAEKRAAENETTVYPKRAEWKEISDGVERAVQREITSGDKRKIPMTAAAEKSNGARRIPVSATVRHRDSSSTDPSAPSSAGETTTVEV